jgi:hypothetical protein
MEKSSPSDFSKTSRLLAGQARKEDTRPSNGATSAEGYARWRPIRAEGGEPAA